MRSLPILMVLLAAPVAVATPPNVIIVMTDDQGYGDLGVHGNPVLRTPHLDAMATRSVRVDPFYVSPVCAPTRAALMTGRYCQRTHAIDTYIGRAMLEPEEVTLAEMLRGAGYATGIFGKWHLGDCRPMRPIDQGFDESWVHRGGGIGQPSDPIGAERRYTDPTLVHNDELVACSGYCTDVYFDKAIDWIRVRGDAPFFAYIATNAPHGPFHDVPRDAYESCASRDLSPVMPPNGNVDRHARIFAMIENIDLNVGKLFSALEELDLVENTVVVYLHDNGANTRRYADGLRGMKGEVHEGGVRSPLFVHWPGRLEPRRLADVLSAHVDIVPTVLEACGVEPPADIEFDGRSLWPVLTGAGPAPQRDVVIQAHRGNRPVRYHHMMVRRDNWKLVNASGFGRELPGAAVEPAFELYDLGADPAESHDRAGEHADIVAELRGAYDRWFDAVGADDPANYGPPPITLGAWESTLTRQDWTVDLGKPGWAKFALGEWLVHAARPMVADFDVYLMNGTRANAVIVRFGDAVVSERSGDWSSEAPIGLKVELPAGTAALAIELRGGEKEPVGPYQVIIRSRDGS